MIVLDTNVISELTSSRPDAKVQAWAASLPFADLFTTAITVAEVRYGIGMMPYGQKRRMLAGLADAMFEQDSGRPHTVLRLGGGEGLRRYQKRPEGKGQAGVRS
jgi:hypothetical protein